MGNIVELKRGIRKICSEALMNEISNLQKFLYFYRDVFLTYNVLFDTETIRQKRSFVAAVTKYFILDRLPSEYIYIEDGLYFYKPCKIREYLTDAVNMYYEIHDSSSSNQDFMKRYACYLQEEIRNFSKEISENRDDSLSDFSKFVEKLYYSKGKDKQK